VGQEAEAVDPDAGAFETGQPGVEVLVPSVRSHDHQIYVTAGQSRHRVDHPGQVLSRFDGAHEEHVGPVETMRGPNGLDRIATDLLDVDPPRNDADPLRVETCLTALASGRLRWDEHELRMASSQS